MGSRRVQLHTYNRQLTTRIGNGSVVTVPIVAVVSSKPNDPFVSRHLFPIRLLAYTFNRYKYPRRLPIACILVSVDIKIHGYKTALFCNALARRSVDIYEAVYRNSFMEFPPSLRPGGAQW